jgi:hypothetical protein
MFPRARTDNLTVRKLPDETLIYDRVRHKGHCLNTTSALVWSLCDGQKSQEDIARLIGTEMGLVHSAEVVGLALEQLGRRGLLVAAPALMARADRLSRREALKQLAISAAVLPLIMTIATKAAAQALSGQARPDPNMPAQDPPIAGATPPQNQPPPCRQKGQSCVAQSSGVQGTCCNGLHCNGVAQGAGVCS